MTASIVLKTAARVAAVCLTFTAVTVISGLVGSVATSTSAHAVPTVPEPASMLMLGVGVAGLIAARRQAR